MPLLKKLLSALPLLAAAFVSPLTAAETIPPKFRDATPLEWSHRMAKSEMARIGDTGFRDVNPNAKWSYTLPLVGLCLQRLSSYTGDKSYGEWGARTATSFIRKDGTIEAYSAEDYNIDLVAPGKVLVRHWDEENVHTPELRKAIESLREQMRTHPRNSDGGFWHKKRYPNQMWLDGLFMASPFLAHYGKTFGETAAADEVFKQIALMDKHGYDPKTGLYFHAYDEARAQPWADKQTGDSPSFWSRSIGWYAMAIVDSLEYLPTDHQEMRPTAAILHRVADGIVKWQDAKTGLWWQVTDQGARQGNYLEATASAMFVYSLAKGINLGILEREKYLPTVIKGYEGIIRDLIRIDADGAIHLTQCCEVAGLGGTSRGRARDGTFEYYISEAIIENDHKGVGPLIAAGIELDILAKAKKPVFQARGWADYQKVLANIKDPVFPKADFPILQFGAKVDTDSTKAIQAAIDACSLAGGGRVVVPAGKFLTGALTLKSNVNLHLVEGATLEWIFDTSLYPIVFTRWEGMECMNYQPFIYAYGQENIAVTGKGTLDGAATWETWWSWNDKKNKGPKHQRTARAKLLELAEAGVPVKDRVFGDGHYLRPNFVQPYNCKNVLIEGVTVLRSPMWEIHPVLCTNVTVRGLKIVTNGPNNDGCDPESCTDVLIEDTLFDTGDDCIAIKSGRNNDGRRVGVPTSNVVVRNCIMKEGHGGVVLGSECSGDIRNVFIENCTMDSPILDRALRFKNNAVRGGVLENVFMRDVTIGQVSEAVVTIDLLYEEGAKGPFKPIVRNVQLDRVKSSASPRVIFVRGFEGAIVDDIRINDSEFLGLSEPDVIEHVGSVSFRNVKTAPAKAVKAKNSVPPPTAQ